METIFAVLRGTKVGAGLECISCALKYLEVRWVSGDVENPVIFLLNAVATAEFDLFISLLS